MEEYQIRGVTPADYPFLADSIVSAERGNSGILSYAKIFGLGTAEVHELIIKLFEEDIDGCEFSPSSYLVATDNGVPVASLGGWIEAFNGNLPSKLIKSNLLNSYLKKEQIHLLKSKFSIIKELIIEREPMTLQLEYMYASRAYRGKGLHTKLGYAHWSKAREVFQDVAKVQVHIFKNNFVAMNAFEKDGFKKVKSYKASNKEILNYLPGNVKVLLEMDLTKIPYGKE